MLVLAVGTPEGRRTNIRLDGKAAEGPLALVVDAICWMRLPKRKRSIAHH